LIELSEVTPAEGSLTEYVRSLTGAHQRHLKLGSRNGHGFSLAGLSRADGDGNRFATRWLTVFGIGIWPLGRLYVREGPSSVTERRPAGGPKETVTTTRYAVLGATPLKALEIVRHYAWWLITLLCSVAPSVVLGLTIDGHGALLTLAAVLGIIVMPFVMMMVFGLLLTLYRARWAPLYEVAWSGRRPR
jgi:hypothetical protein